MCSSALSTARRTFLGNRSGVNGIPKLGQPTGETLDAGE